jgi:hypothetical protein
MCEVEVKLPVSFTRIEQEKEPVSVVHLEWFGK